MIFKSRITTLQSSKLIARSTYTSSNPNSKRQSIVKYSSTSTSTLKTTTTNHHQRIHLNDTGGKGSSYNTNQHNASNRLNSKIEGLINPRQLASNLDAYVISQSRAKKILAVAVYNHYTRLRHMAASSLPSPPPPSPSPFLQSLPSYNPDPYASSFQQTDSRFPYPINSNKLTAKVKETPTDQSSESFLSNYPAEISLAEYEVTPNSYAGRMGISKTDKQSSRKRGHSNAEPLTIDEDSTTEPDPTRYDSASSSLVSLLRSQEHLQRQQQQSTSSSPNSGPTQSQIDSLRQILGTNEILSDFVGQVAGAPPPPPPLPSPPSSSTKSDPNALVFDKSNVLLLGPSGSGKTLLARTLARTLDVPFVSVEATGLTMAGYVGDDIETCIQRLLVAAEWDVDKAGQGIVFIDEIDKISRSSSASFSKDVSGEGVQQAMLKILEGTVVSVADKEGAANAVPGRRKTPPKESYLVDTTNILFILSGAFVGLEKIISQRVEKGSIGFTTKPTPPPFPITTNSVTSFNTFESQEEVKNESKSTNVEIKKDVLNLLEPADLVKFGFIPEFIGRLPVIATLSALSEADLLKILTYPKNALIKQYTELFNASGVEIRFTLSALKAIASLAVGKGTGARGLRSILEGLLLESMFDAPQSSIRYILIDRDVVKGISEAKYYSRGQLSIFESEFQAEEGQERALEEEVKGEKVKDDEAVVELKRATG